MKKKSIVYSEPADYFPEEIRKAAKIGEYYEPDEENPDTEKAADKDTKKDDKKGVKKSI